MKINKMVLLVIAFILPIVALASGAEHHEVTMENSDLKFRALNFSIFAILIYYLVSTPIREFFKGRSAEIERQIKEIEAKLQESEKEEKLAKENFNRAKARAKEIVADSHNEAKILADNIAKKGDELIVSLEKNLDSKIEVEQKRMVKDTINELLESSIENSDIAVDNSKVVSLVSKKVA